MSYRDLVLLQRPTMYLPMEESSGSVAADITGNGFDGTYNNVSLAAQTGFSVFGGPQTYATFNGTSSYLSIAKRWHRGGGFTISGWCKASSIAGWRQLVHLSNLVTANAGPCLYGSANGGGTFALANAPAFGTNTMVTAPSQTIAVGEIVHFAVVAHGHTARVYKNGALAFTYNNTTGNFAPSSGVLPMVIGAGYVSSATVVDFFAGWISNFAGWSRPLSADEILMQYNTGKALSDQPYVSGTVLDNGVGASKRIKWMRRDTGLLVAATTSAADGSFIIKTPSAVGMAVCLDDGATNYEPLIFDRVTPQT